MSKHAKGHKPAKRDATAGVKAKPSYFMVYTTLIVLFSILLILICSGAWTPW